MLNWTTLLSNHRIGQAATAEPSVRSDYQRDYDRLIFSAAFRRLKDKTQVFPLEKNDHARTRLIHSLEVSCVGRSLGSSIGQTLLQKYPELCQQNITPSDIGDIVAAASLAHDLGNPPFGHLGEQAMRDYFRHPDQQPLLKTLTTAQKKDFYNIEGNAQGFRICNRLESPDTHGGLRLTAATLASASKYPTSAYAQHQHYNKNGVYQDDLQDFSEIFQAVGIPQKASQRWSRHPLSYLTEAADDICYLIVDLEDAYQIGQIPYQDAHDHLATLADTLIDPKRLNELNSKSDRLSYLRAKAIGRLVHEVIDAFWDNESALLNTTNPAPLLQQIPSANTLKTIRNYSKIHLYQARPVLEIQIAGHRVLNGLLHIFCTSIAHSHHQTTDRYQQIILTLLPSRYRRPNQTLYQQLLSICDYISGMTDSYAVSLYKKLTGISLPVP